MTRTGSIQHETEVKKTIKKYQSEGYRAIDLQGLSPDIIAVKDNRIFAIEVIGRKKGHTMKQSIRWKKDQYSMFDDVLIERFVYERLNYK